MARRREGCYPCGHVSLALWGGWAGCGPEFHLSWVSSAEPDRICVLIMIGFGCCCEKNGIL